jgi:hypothetical protein
VLFNTARIHDLWPILLDHIVEVLGEAKQPVRTAAVDSLGRALGGALTSLHGSAGEDIPLHKDFITQTSTQRSTKICDTSRCALPLSIAWGGPWGEPSPAFTGLQVRILHYAKHSMTQRCRQKFTKIC